MRWYLGCMSYIGYQFSLEVQVLGVDSSFFFFILFFPFFLDFFVLKKIRQTQRGSDTTRATFISKEEVPLLEPPLYPTDLNVYVSVIVYIRHIHGEKGFVYLFMSSNIVY